MWGKRGLIEAPRQSLTFYGRAPSKTNQLFVSSNGANFSERSFNEFGLKWDHEVRGHNNMPWNRLSRVIERIEIDFEDILFFFLPITILSLFPGGVRESKRKREK